MNDPTDSVCAAITLALEAEPVLDDNALKRIVIARDAALWRLSRADYDRVAPLFGLRRQSILGRRCRRERRWHRS